MKTTPERRKRVKTERGEKETIEEGTRMNETHWAAKEKEIGIEVRPTDSFIFIFLFIKNLCAL